jgi:Isopropylmalate/homocitrate/citramalate synthases
VKAYLVDTTLRDGEQSPGLVFSAAEKLAIAQCLDRAGVFAIEAGIPAMGKEERAALSILASQPMQARVIAWNRAHLQDIEASVRCGFSWIHISIPISDLHIRYKLGKDRHWILVNLAKAIAYAKSCGCRVLVGAEDASRADEDFFLQVAEVSAGGGAERIRFADTIGCLEPFGCYERMKRLVSRCPLPIEIHTHNDFGLAVANTISAIEAGVEFASVTVGGIGERAGNASLEEVVNDLGVLYGVETSVEPEKLLPAQKILAQAAFSGKRSTMA